MNASYGRPRPADAEETAGTVTPAAKVGNRILLTGGTGFLGGNLARALAGGNMVRLLVRKDRPAGWDDVCQGDLTDYTSLLAATQQIDVVYHVAGVRAKGGVKDEDYWRVNVEGTENLLRAAIENGVRHFVYCGSVAGGDSVSAELPYARSKRAAEAAIQKFANCGVPTTIIRPTITYGPGDAWGMITKMCIMIQNGTYVIVGSGANRLHLTYVDDTLQAFLRVMLNERAYGKTYIVASQEPIGHAQLAGIIARELGVPPPKVRIPAFAAYPAAAVVETLYRALKIEKEPIINTHKVDIAVKDQVYDISLAARELGYQPQVGYEAGIRKTVAWFREEGILR